MYKPVPLVQSQLDGDDSECEAMLTSEDFDRNVEDSGNEDTVELGVADAKPTELSPARKIAFIFSILNCVAFVVIFVWILPCDYNSCQGAVMKREKEWEVEFKEKATWLLQLAPSSSNKAEEVVVVANSNLYSNTLNVSSLCLIGNSTDMVGVRASDGNVLWKQNTTERVEYLNCSIIDLNNDGVSDCLIFDQSNGFRAFGSHSGAPLWRSNWSTLGYDLSSVMIEDIQAASLSSTNSLSDLLILLSDADSLTLVGVSYKNGDVLFHHRLPANCSLLNEQLTIDDVLSASFCVNTTDLKSIEFSRKTTQLQPDSSTLEISKCEKCAPLIAGVPASRYVLHKGLKDFLVVANVNCSGLQTQLKKTNV